MRLTFTITHSLDYIPEALLSKTFDCSGGMIGRDEQCAWVIPDSHQHVSNQHAVVSYQNGEYYLADYKSSNGTSIVDTGELLAGGTPMLIRDGMVFALAHCHISARLLADTTQPKAAPADESVAGLSFSSVVSPSWAVDEPTYAEDYANVLQPDDHAPTHTQHMTLPNLIPEAVESEVVPPQPEPAPVAQSEEFWQRFGAVLGIDLSQLDNTAREALALHSAKLLKQSVSGLQRSLHTRQQLKTELQLSLTGSNSLLHQADTSEQALHGLLADHRSSEHAIAAAFNDLQAHQVAMLAACRAALRGALHQFAPNQLVLGFEQSRQPSGWAASRWRSYCRHHQALSQDPTWQTRLLGRDFSQAYEEHERLIGALHNPVAG